MAKLTPKQDAFVNAYLLNGGNATQAAISSGYSKKTANEQGAQNLAKLSIKEEIQEHQKEAQKDFIWSKEKKLELLQRRVNVADTEDGEKGMINMQSAIAAIKEHNLMQGDNGHVESNTSIKVDKPLAEMITGGSKR